MLQLTPQTRVYLAVEPADFRRGIDGLAALCRQRLGEDPMDGAIFVFRNRRSTALTFMKGVPAPRKMKDTVRETADRGRSNLWRFDPDS